MIRDYEPQITLPKLEELDKKYGVIMIPENKWELCPECNDGGILKKLHYNNPEGIPEIDLSFCSCTGNLKSVWFQRTLRLEKNKHVLREYKLKKMMGINKNGNN